ncbi:MAG: response regulator [Desulfosalsimonas sp.]
MKIKLMLVDNQLVIRQGIKELLSGQKDMEVAAEAASGAEALEMIRKVKPDVAVIEPDVPGLENLDNIARYRQAGGGTEILILTAEKSRKKVRDCLQAGARGYVLKTAPISEIIAAIRTVHDKGYHLSPDISAEIIDTFMNKQDTATEASRYSKLSRREQQVFRLLAEGATTGEIAGTLKISPKTVAKHRMSIMEKLLLKNTASLVRYAARIGVLDYSS